MMLLKSVQEACYLQPADQIYNPLTNYSQAELMEKFNLAFYEAQTVSKTDIIETLQDLQENKTNDDDLIDFLISEDSNANDCDINFDFNDFVEDFDHNVRESFSDSTVEFDTETFTTESSSSATAGPVKEFSNFYVSPPIWTGSEKTPNDFDDINICEVLSDASLDIGDWSSEIQNLEEPSVDEYSCLPPVGTIVTKNNFDFNCYVRNIPNDDMGYLKQDSEFKSEFGHLLKTSETRNCDFVANTLEKEQMCHVLEQNHMVLPQSDALLNDDPLLSSSNNFYASQTQLISDNLEPEEADKQEEEEETSSVSLYQCKWENCYQNCYSQPNLVNHIEKRHVELKRGDEFTCFWEQCPRKTKPFNARYKLLIHMRVHSGEKPNKCPFKGCNKAFSRLENLKIHQRSHTGERPYLCQFSGCSKCFSNSSDRAKHQRTHFDTKPYGCQVNGCLKRYTDPSSLRKHVKTHSHEEQLQIKKKTPEEGLFANSNANKLLLDPSRQKAIKIEVAYDKSEYDHTYSNNFIHLNKFVSINVRKDLKIKIEKNKIKRTMF